MYENRLECCNGNGPGLGFLPAFLAPLIGTAARAGITRLTSGGSRTVCPTEDSPQEVARVWSLLSASDKRVLEAAHAQANGGKPIPWDDPGLFAHRAVGGDDCVASGAAGQRFLNTWLAMKAAAGSGPGPSPGYVQPAFDPWREQLRLTGESVLERVAPRDPGRLYLPGGVSAPTWVPLAVGVGALLLFLRR